jgi:formylglycine-generating enzyme required for sulfatase activity
LPDLATLIPAANDKHSSCGHLRVLGEIIMKSGFFILMMLLAVLGMGVAPQATRKPLSKEQIMDLVSGSVPSARVAELVQENGIDFEPTEEYLNKLREAGAEQVAIDALRAADASNQQAQRVAKARQAVLAANTLMDIGDIDGAIKLYRESIEANPNDPEAHRLLGMALGVKKDWPGDISEQRAAILLNPSDEAAQAEIKSAMQAMAKATTAELVIKALPGVDVYLNNESKGRTGPKGELKIGDLKPGDYSLLITLHGKQPFSQKIDLVAGQSKEIEAELADSLGRIVVHTEADAEVFLDSTRRGVADSKGVFTVPNAAPGTHELRVSAANKKDFHQTLMVTAGGETMVSATMVDLPPTPGMVRTNPKDGLKYAFVPPGKFMMGCSPGERKCDKQEKPPHPVSITKGFWMSQVEVTAGAYKRYAKAAQRSMPPPPIFNREWENDKLPIVKVSWLESQDFCKWAGGRLPTEAEWEYAARGGTNESLYGPLDEISVYARNSGNGHGQWGNPNMVGLKHPNTFNIYDMLGNVFEWTNDWYDSDYYDRSPSSDPQGPPNGKEKVVRGRAWVANGEDMRVSYRGSEQPDKSFFEGGFRCTLDILKP